jgi:hypothetical protein
MLDHLTGVARSIPAEELAAAVARQRLTACLTDHPVAPLTDCLQIGAAVGLSMSEMQRVTGFARQTLYRHRPNDTGAERNPPRPQAAIEVLMLLAAEGEYASPALLARRARLSAPLVTGVLTDLDADRLCDVRRDSYASLEAAPTEATYIALREHFDDLYLRRPDATSVYVAIPEERPGGFEQAALAVLASYEHDVIPMSVAPSVMTGPELAILVNAPTIRRALAVTHAVWTDILERAGMPHSGPIITNVIAPGNQPIKGSAVLDAYLEAAIDSGAPNADALRRVRDAFTGGVSEIQLTGRCVTTAALALRRSAGNDGDPRPISDGDTAFAELQPASGVPVRSAYVPIKRATVAALELATDNLGPLPGGRLGSFRQPGEPAHVTEGVSTRWPQLVEIARLSGEAVGLAAAKGKLDAGEAIQRVVSGATT